LSWWKKLVQLSQSVLKGEVIVKNPELLDTEFLEAVMSLFGPVSEVDDGLSVGLIRYVIDGESDEVLLKLSGAKAAAEKLGYSTNPLHYFGAGTEARLARAMVVQKGSRVPSAVWVRFARTMAAAARAAGPVTVQSEYPDWVPALISEVVFSYHDRNRIKQYWQPWTADRLEEIFVSDELPGDLLIVPMLDKQAGQMFHGPYSYMTNFHLQAFTQLDKYFQKYPARIKSFLAGQTGAEERVFALKVLSELKFDFSPIPESIVQIGTGSSKSAREAALPLLMTCRAAARPLLEQMLKESSAAERNEVVGVLWRLFGKESSETLQKHLEVEKSDRVRQTIERHLSVPEATVGVDASTMQLPPCQVEIGEFALSPETRKHLHAHFNKGLDALKKHYEQQMKQWDSPERPQWMRAKPVPPEPLAEDKERKILRFVEGSDPTPGYSQGQADNMMHILLRSSGAPTGEWLASPEIKLIHIVRLCYVLQNLQIHARGLEFQSLIWYDLSCLEAYRSQCQTPFGLRELDMAVASLPGSAPGLVLDGFLRLNNKWQSFCDWEPEAIWPAYAEHPELLRNIILSKASAPDYYSFGAKRQNTFRVLAMFPQVPDEFMTLLWDLALGEGKSDRPMAQAALAAAPNKVEKIKGSLQDGKAEIRAAAAEWLGKLGETSAIEPIKRAFAKEKSEMVKGVFMLALDALHADVDEFLDRDELAAEARAGIAKKRPKGMEWVPLESLPKLHWQDNGKELDPGIVQWWVVQCIQQKHPMCGPILKRYLSMCRKQEVSALARYILSAWIARDTGTLSSEEAAEKARQETDKLWNQYGSQKYFTDIYGGIKDNLYKQIFQKTSTDCIHSAIDQKGMLALVAAGGDADCVKMCEQYIRTWYGMRAAQCKSLVEALACMDHPLALQSLLAFANRFRTKSIKQTAEEQVQAIAERRGWTIDELADRTIPDGGFERPLDENGAPLGDEAILVLDFGPRQFEVRLDDELEPVITVAGEAKPLKNLPAPGKNDDEVKAAAAKKTLSDAKKVVKEVVKRQKERFYEAVCTQRSWLAGDWQRYLCQHPVCGRLCVRLAWAAYAPAPSEAPGKGEFLGCFRPLADGSLTNEEDEEIKLPEDAIVVLAHTCNTPAELGERWLKHFQDYDVPVLFQQFGRPIYNLPDKKAKATEVSDFEGHMLTTFKLRGKATKLGYVRGEAEDGGCFFVYRKSFSSLSIQAVLEFTGSCLPEQDVPAALMSLYFLTIQQDREQSHWQPAKMPLSKVPPVLLSECYNDIKQIAAEGSGYDPNWKDKGYF
jgi:hypothetical protein